MGNNWSIIKGSYRLPNTTSYEKVLHIDDKDGTDSSEDEYSGLSDHQQLIQAEKINAEEIMIYLNKRIFTLTFWFLFCV